MLSSAAFAELDTVTYVDASGGAENNAGVVPAGRVEGDISGVGEVTLYDTDGGDMWNGGDQFIYLHEGSERSGNFTATVRVVSQTEAVDGRWGKAGIRASSTLDGNSANAMAQIATGNGSQADPPSSGGAHNPVPARIGGRTMNDGTGGFERPILDASGAEVPNNVFAEAGTNVSWLSLSYDAGSNAFISGIAPDNGGSPGEWSYSEPATDVPSDGGWYVGLAYSAHGDLAIAEDGDRMHGVTFDNFSIVPEPASVGMALIGVLGLLGFRRRR